MTSWFSRRARDQRTRAQKVGATATLSPQQLRRAFKRFKGCCAYCGKELTGESPTVDHFIPLSAPSSPGSVATNIVPACYDCNHSKGCRQPLDWLSETFGVERANLIITRIERYFKELQR